MHRHSRDFASLSLHRYIYPSLSPSHSLIHSFPLSLLISVLPLFLSLFLPSVSHLEFLSFPFPSPTIFMPNIPPKRSISVYRQTDKVLAADLNDSTIIDEKKEDSKKYFRQKKINLLSFEF